MTADVIDLAAIRASRSRRAEERAANFAHCIEVARPMVKALNFGSYTAPPPVVPPAPTPPPAPRPTLVWHSSKRGNWWVKDAVTQFHVVIYETSRGWSGRATPPQGDGFYLNGLRADTLEEAQGAVELWLREQDGGGVSDPASNPHRWRPAD